VMKKTLRPIRVIICVSQEMHERLGEAKLELRRALEEQATARAAAEKLQREVTALSENRAQLAETVTRAERAQKMAERESTEWRVRNELEVQKLDSVKNAHAKVCSELQSRVCPVPQLKLSFSQFFYLVFA
jgi:predicted  nucleic acid-binding Zn-ribbon protein